MHQIQGRLRYVLAGVAAVVLVVTGAVLSLPAQAANIDTMTFPGRGTLQIKVTTTPANQYDPRWLMFTMGSDDRLYLCETGPCSAQTYTTPVLERGTIFDLYLGENDGNVRLGEDNAFSLHQDSATVWTFTRLPNLFNFVYTVKLTFTAVAVPSPSPSTSPTPTATPGPVTLAPTTVGESRVGATWKVGGTFSGPLQSYAWLRCTALETATCTPIAGATAATYRTKPADLDRFVAVDVVDANGKKGRTPPRYVLEDVCKVPIEFNDGHYYSTRSRASMTIAARPGWGCLRINLYIAAKTVDGLGYGNDRGPSSLADASKSKGSIWVNFETGRVDVVANHTDTVGAFFSAFPINVTTNPDSGFADALLGCIQKQRQRLPYTLDGTCQTRVSEQFRKPNSAGFYFPSLDTSGDFRVRYHFTNAARRVTNAAPAAIDGIFGFGGTADGRLSLSCAFIDKFPSIEMYQDWPSPEAGANYTLRSLFQQTETTPRDLAADAAKYSQGTCGRIDRPTTKAASLQQLTGVVAQIGGRYYAPIGADPYEDVIRDFKPWSPM